MNPLIDPDEFFGEKMKRGIEWRYPALTVLLVGIIGAVSAYIVAEIVIRAIMPELPPDATAIARIAPIFGAAVAVFMAFFMWFIYTAVFYVLSSFFGGEGEFKRLLQFTGYGFIPQIFSSLITLFLLRYTLSGIDFSMENPELFQQTLMSDPMMKYAAIVSMIFLIWSANIWMFAVKHARKMEMKQAALTVGIPIGLYVLYQIVSFIFLME